MLALHYPPVDRKGRLYDDALHGLANAAALARVLQEAPKRPVLIACGHQHQGFRSALALPDGSRIPVVNCGSSGQAHQPARGRQAATARYTFEDDGTVTLQRFVHDGTSFVPEAGGSFGARLPAA